MPTASKRSPLLSRDWIVTAVPFPGSLTMRAMPADCTTKSFTMLRPRPCPYAHALRREERLEGLRLDLRRHSHAGIGDGESDEIAGQPKIVRATLASENPDADIVMVPPATMASLALIARFETTADSSR